MRHLLPELGLARRSLAAGLLLAAGVGVWFAGLIVANVRVVCRLF
jgi:hypothetical protein